LLKYEVDKLLKYEVDKRTNKLAINDIVRVKPDVRDPDLGQASVVGMAK
jgi:hypothetical protein